MFSLLLLTLLVSCSSHPLTHEFIGAIADLDGIIGLDAPESAHIGTGAFSAGLFAYDLAVRQPVPYGCPQYVELAVGYTMYSVVKSIAGFVAFMGPLNTKFYAFLQSRPCDSVSLEKARKFGFDQAVRKVNQMWKDQYSSFYLPEDNRPRDLALELKAESTYHASHFAYTKLVCFDKNPKCLFPVLTCPNYDSPVVAKDWADLLAHGNGNTLTASQRLTSHFWYGLKLGDAYNTAWSWASIFFLFGRQLVERQCGNDLRKELQQYTLLTTSILNMLRTVYSYEYQINSYPVQKLMTEPTFQGYSYDRNWKSANPTNFPSYPNSDLPFLSSFIAFAENLAPNQALSLTVYSNSTETRYFANYQDLHDEFSDAMFWSGLGFQFSFDAGKDLGKKVTEATINLLQSGMCPGQYSN